MHNDPWSRLEQELMVLYPALKAARKAGDRATVKRLKAREKHIRERQNFEACEAWRAIAESAAKSDKSKDLDLSQGILQWLDQIDR
jgi:hypothetical protein